MSTLCIFFALVSASMIAGDLLRITILCIILLGAAYLTLGASFADSIKFALLVTLPPSLLSAAGKIAGLDLSLISVILFLSLLITAAGVPLQPIRYGTPLSFALSLLTYLRESTHYRSFGKIVTAAGGGLWVISLLAAAAIPTVATAMFFLLMSLLEAFLIAREAVALFPFRPMYSVRPPGAASSEPEESEVIL